jgi:high-affinity nickel-transport protein
VALRIAVLPAWASVTQLLVAAVLVVLGVSNLRVLLGRGAGHPSASAVGTGGCAAASWRALGVGVVHGLAGSAAVALVAVAAMPSPRAAFGYLAVFALGTVAGMVALSFGLGLPAGLAGGRPMLAHWALAGSGVLSIGVGLYLAVEVGVSTL